MTSGGKQFRFAFTLAELIVVVLIVGILAAAAVPIYRGRIDKTKWSEGTAMMGTIATQIRVWCSEHSAGYSGPFPKTLAELGFNPGDLTGTYFSDADFTVINVISINPLIFTITCTPLTQPDRPRSPSSMTLIANPDGSIDWLETF